MAASSTLQTGAPAHPFDAVAAGYDAAFTDRRLGRWLRAIVWAQLARAFRPGDRLLELGCGTGEDAVWLARRGMKIDATDASPAMLAETRRKAAAAGVDESVTTRVLDLTAPLGSLGAPDGERYDGAYSNFGPLNCVEDRRALAGELARLVRPGGKLVLVVMGPLCPWEVAWHLARLRPRGAIRRFRSGKPAHVGDDVLPVWYPSPHRLAREFAPHFEVREHIGVGLLLPHSEMSELVDRAPGLFAGLARIDRRFAGALPWRWLNDHYLMVLERR
ncbi:MAG TPA: class I SAM-dependent methyltransferase [Thermomicrobiales bacterium]|nr:class I SAM-dependent methyltransferase [Thermomicrobiales bacterium]